MPPFDVSTSRILREVRFLLKIGHVPAVTQGLVAGQQSSRRGWYDVDTGILLCLPVSSTAFNPSSAALLLLVG